MAENTPSGLFVKGDDGTLYFLRDELLEAAKVEGEDLERWGPVVDGDEPEVEGFSLDFDVKPFSVQSILVSGAQLAAPSGQHNFNQAGGSPSGGVIRRVTYSTVMCPW